MEEQLYEWWFEEFKELPFQIIDHGEINTTDGPDINNVIIEYQGVRESGQIELDFKSSYWISHGHFQNHRFQNVLLHLTMYEDITLSTGFIPKYSFSIDRFLFTENTKPQEFWSKKFAFIETFTPFYSQDQIFKIIFARALGFFHNKDVMTFIATLKLGLNTDNLINPTHYLQSKINDFKRATRPNNRIEKRLAQYLKLTKSPAFLNQVQHLIRSRFELKILLKEFASISKGYKAEIGRERFLQWLFNGIIPYEHYFSSSDEKSYQIYLDQLMLELKEFKAIASFHS